MRTALAALLLLMAATTQSSASEQWVRGVDHVGLTVSDLAASESFFKDSLGFSVAGRDKEYPAVFLRNGHVLVTLWRATKPEAAVPFDRKRNIGLHHLALRVDSFSKLAELHSLLEKAPGVRIEFAPELLSDGPAMHMMIREPSGNRLEFIHRPALDM